MTTRQRTRAVPDKPANEETVLDPPLQIKVVPALPAREIFEAAAAAPEGVDVWVRGGSYTFPVTAVSVVGKGPSSYLLLEVGTDPGCGFVVTGTDPALKESLRI